MYMGWGCYHVYYIIHGATTQLQILQSRTQATLECGLGTRLVSTLICIPCVGVVMECSSRIGN